MCSSSLNANARRRAALSARRAAVQEVGGRIQPADAGGARGCAGLRGFAIGALARASAVSMPSCPAGSSHADGGTGGSANEPACVKQNGQ